MRTRLFHAVIAGGIAFGASAIACSATDTTTPPTGGENESKVDPSEEPSSGNAGSSATPGDGQGGGTQSNPDDRVRAWLLAGAPT